MTREPPTRSRVRRLLAIGSVAIAVALGAGVALASLTVHSGSEIGVGSAEPTGALGYWSQTAVAFVTIPSTVPSLASGIATAPTVLPASDTNFTLNNGTGGHAAVRWDFSEKSPATSTEFTLIVSIVNATSGLPTLVVVYLETQATAPSGTLAFSLFLDVGASAPTLEATGEIAQQCGAVGSCP